MPLLLVALVSLGIQETLGWRIAMFLPGVMMLAMAVLYWRCTQDSPEGNTLALRAQGITASTGKKGGWAVFKQAMANYRVWMLAMCYAAGFGVEVFIHGVAATYYVDRFGLTLTTAGIAAGSFGLMALFARALGGIPSDRIARHFGLDGRTWLLFMLLVGEGAGLLAFSAMGSVGPAIAVMLVFGLFTHMSCGAIYSLVSFPRPQGPGRCGRHHRRGRQHRRGGRRVPVQRNGEPARHAVRPGLDRAGVRGLCRHGAVLGQAQAGGAAPV